jgi:hypothetical protein
VGVLTRLAAVEDTGRETTITVVVLEASEDVTVVVTPEEPC